MAPKSKSQTQKTGIAVPPEWQEKIPRFLFRGWKPSSGGNSGLNTTSAVTPHAFYGSRKVPPDKSISEISKERIKSEVRMHLCGSIVKSHFSSWAADFQTALDYAGVGKEAHLAVFDTSLRGQHNEIYHVRALHEIFIAPGPFVHEYLVYGPVSGDAYTCVSVMHLREQGMAITAESRNSTAEISKDNLAHASKIANKFRSINHGLGPDLYLTVFAAELSRLLRAARGFNHAPGCSQKDNRAILTHLSDAVDLSAKLPLKTSLVNPKTYDRGFPQLKAMIDILVTVGVEIDRKRSKISTKSSTTTTTVPPEAGQKRKVDDLDEVKQQKEFPCDLLEDLASHGNTFQKRLQVARDQLESMHDFGTQARALKAKLVSTKKELGALSTGPERDAKSSTMRSLEQAASCINGVTTGAQAFDTELYRAETSFNLLEKSCNEIFKSIDMGKVLFARPEHRESDKSSESSSSSSLPDIQLSNQPSHISQNRTKRTKQKQAEMAQRDKCVSGSGQSYEPGGSRGGTDFGSIKRPPPSYRPISWADRFTQAGGFDGVRLGMRAPGNSGTPVG